MNHAAGQFAVGVGGEGVAVDGGDVGEGCDVEVGGGSVKVSKGVGVFVTIVAVGFRVGAAVAVVPGTVTTTVVAVGNEAMTSPPAAGVVFSSGSSSSLIDCASAALVGSWGRGDSRFWAQAVAMSRSNARRIISLRMMGFFLRTCSAGQDSGVMCCPIMSRISIMPSACMTFVVVTSAVCYFLHLPSELYLACIGGH